jgi:predicted DNA-binding transcriptional regulator YafY
MKNKNALTRYRLIDNRMTIRQKPAPSLQDLVEYVSEKMGSPISVAAIQKDIYAMRYDESLGFFAPIEYDIKKRAYVYTDPNYSIHHIPVSEEDLQGLELAIGILEQFKEIPAIKLFDDAISRLASTVKQSREKQNDSSVLLLDRPRRYQGIEFMADIVDAIHTKHVLRVLYQPFSKTEAKKHTVHPYFIKEYNGRMYLIGKAIHPTKESKFLTFAFDRMQDVLKMNQVFHEEEMDRANYFKSAIGITLPDTMPEHILIQVHPQQIQYLKTQPIHHSQQIISETPESVTISLDLVVNYELKTLLLSFGDKLKVLQPEHLAQDIKDTGRRMYEQYT